MDEFEGTDEMAWEDQVESKLMSSTPQSLCSRKML
jgi:hypothetical protein